MSNTKNNLAWIKLFDKHKILDNINKEGFYIIKSSDINVFREARLMTKFDFKSQLPNIFSKSNLSILPITRGSYVISSFNTFESFTNSEIEIEKIEFPNFIEGIDYNNITSEATSINCAYISGMISNFLGEDKLFPTVNGRMSSLNFNFNIETKNNNLEIEINNAQLEIDGGYEGYDSLTLIEAKNSISSDFLIRQLYYPYRLWQNKITKPIRNVFLTYTNGIFHFREYIFNDLNNYNSIELLREKKYVISSGAINMEVINTIIDNVKQVTEPQIPFPQANSFERVINLCELLNENKFLSKNDITQMYDFDQRQTDYYSSAGLYLGFLQKSKVNKIIGFELTQKGQDLFKVSLFDRQKLYIESILSHTVFKRSLEAYIKQGAQPSKTEVVKIMKTSSLYNVGSDKTYYRRSSTILSWLDWILNQIEE